MAADTLMHIHPLDQAPHLGVLVHAQIVFLTPAHARGMVAVTVKVNGVPRSGGATYTYAGINTLPATHVAGAASSLTPNSQPMHHP